MKLLIAVPDGAKYIELDVPNGMQHILRPRAIMKEIKRSYIPDLLIIDEACDVDLSNPIPFGPNK